MRVHRGPQRFAARDKRACIRSETHFRIDILQRMSMPDRTEWIQTSAAHDGPIESAVIPHRCILHDDRLMLLFLLLRCCFR